MARLTGNRPSEVWLYVLLVGLTAVLVGYFSVWLPGPSAGLRLIGFELGEWIKFLGVGSARDLFYLPPILLGLIMALLSAGWDNRSWKTWAFRGLAVLVSLLAFPAVAAITSEPQSEWLARLIGIALVVVVAVGVAFVPAGATSRRWVGWIILVLCLLGIILPLWQYFTVRPIVADILRRPIGVGLGLWLNSIGFFLVGLVVARQLFPGRENNPATVL
ncbi:MAG: hypothetical protein R3C44_09465 [Chloroflexota bacterium]